jgi:hypothetical protein
MSVKAQIQAPACGRPSTRPAGPGRGLEGADLSGSLFPTKALFRNTRDAGSVFVAITYRAKDDCAHMQPFPLRAAELPTPPQFGRPSCLWARRTFI